MAGIHGEDESSSDYTMKDEQRPEFQPPPLETIGERVAWLRNACNLSLQGFGRRIGYDGSQISRIERNRCHVVDRFVRVVCIQFRVRETWLRLGKGAAFQDGAPPSASAATTAGEAVLPRSTAESRPAGEQSWEEAWQDLRSYVEVLDRLSPRGRAELEQKLHLLVTRVCAGGDSGDDYPLGGYRVREDADEYGAGGEHTEDSSGSVGKELRDFEVEREQEPQTGWGFPLLSFSA